jgi:uncharacterized membrane protein
MKVALRWLLTLAMVTVGIGHFVLEDEFVRMVPSFLPAPSLLVYISGVAEIVLAVGLQIERVRRIAAWGLVALYIAVFPANINMAVNNISPMRIHSSQLGLWLRLPFQALFIAWAWWYTRGPKRE